MKTAMLLLSAMLALFTSTTATAGHAAFSGDGKTVYLIAGDTDELSVLTVETGQVTGHAFKQAIHPTNLRAIATAPENVILLLCDDVLWMWLPANDELKRVRDCPSGRTFFNLACDPKSGATVITALLDKPDDFGSRAQLFYAQKPTAKLVLVWMRRLEDIACPVFLQDGSLLFGAEGDLWHGTIDIDDEPQAFHPAILNATRYAPLADRETSGGTPMQVGVSSIAVSNHKAYVHVARMGGSGWGDILRVNLPPTSEPEPKKDEARITQTYKAYQAALASVERLEDNPSQSFLCNSPDGKLVLFTNNGREDRSHYLVTEDGAPEPLRRP